MSDATHVQPKKGIMIRGIRMVVRSRSSSAKKSAEIIRTLIIGPASISPSSKKPQAISKAQLSKVKSELEQPKSANKVIVQLRNLNLASQKSALLPIGPNNATGTGCGPIRAVCLHQVDEDVWKNHFANLALDQPSHTGDPSSDSALTAIVNTITKTLEGLHIVDLIGTNFDVGRPISSEGSLGDVVPMAETAMTGVKLQSTSLGYTTGFFKCPDHDSVHPPSDRMSVLTHWWGFELVLPPSTLEYLDSADSVSNKVISFLAAIATIINGVQEILPFIRAISQSLELEFDAIKKQNKGHGVVYAATWFMPFALIPRPWDFSRPVTPKLTHPREALSPVLILERQEDGSNQLSGKSSSVSPSEDGSSVADLTSLPSNRMSLSSLSRRSARPASIGSFLQVTGMFGRVESGPYPRRSSNGHHLLSHGSLGTGPTTSFSA